MTAPSDRPSARRVLEAAAGVLDAASQMAGAAPPAESRAGGPSACATGRGADDAPRRALLALAVRQAEALVEVLRHLAEEGGGR